MSTEANGQVVHVRPVRLWFGFATAAFTWIALGCLDIFITFAVCGRDDQFGIPGNHADMRIVSFALAVFLLAVAFSAGVISYRNWRDLSADQSLLETQAVDRREFMAFLGVVVSITLGMGIIWLALPPLFVESCWRAK